MASSITTAIIAVGVLSGVFFWWARKRHLHKQLVDSLSRTLLCVRVMKEQSEKEPKLEDEMGRTERLLSALISSNRPFCLEAAMPHVGEEVHFFVSVPRSAAESAIKQIQGIWPACVVERHSDDYNIFNPAGEAVGAYIKQNQSPILPYRTYKELSADTFDSILSAFAKVAEIGEGAAIQVVVAPVASSAKKSIEYAYGRIKNGEKPDKVLGGISFSSIAKDVAGEISKSPSAPFEANKSEEPKLVDEDIAKSLELKLSKPLFRVNLRLMASAPTKFQAEDILAGLLSGFEQFGAPKRNSLRAVKPKNIKGLAYTFSFREFDAGQEMMLNAEEVVSIFHLPSFTTQAAKIKWLKNREAPPPPNMAPSGALIGWSNFRGEAKPAYIGEEERRRHLYIVGQTGTGKTTLIASMIKDDIKSGKGVCVIDPHGELAEGAIANVPRERLDDLIYFNPADTERPMGLNMLDYNPNKPEEKSFIVNELLSIFDKLYDLKSTGGPMFEYYMRNSLMLLMEDMQNEDATMTEITRIFSDPAYRNRKLERSKNPLVVDFWQKEATKTSGDASLANMAVYINSKFASFISNDYMRPIIGQAKSAFNFREAIDSNKILIVNLSKGLIGDMNASLLGMLFVGKLLGAALSRADSEGGEGGRKDFYLYVDEFQNFTTDSISTILSEARKYRLDLIIAHQFIAQLTDKIRDSVFGNVGNMVAMRVGPSDAEFFEKQFAPTFTRQDLINIDNLNAMARILVANQTSKPFNIKVNNSSWTKGDVELARKMKEYCRLKYGVPRTLVEDEIFRRLRA